MQALETNESIRYEDGMWAFVQYDVMEYITRLEKAKRLLEKSKSRTKDIISHIEAAYNQGNKDTPKEQKVKQCMM